jgi:hypothetical protein
MLNSIFEQLFNKKPVSAASYGTIAQGISTINGTLKRNGTIRPTSTMMSGLQTFINTSSLPEWKQETKF